MRSRGPSRYRLAVHQHPVASAAPLRQPEKQRPFGSPENEHCPVHSPLGSQPAL